MTSKVSRLHSPEESKRTKIIFDNPSTGITQVFLEKIGEDGSTETVKLLSPDGSESDSLTVRLTDAPRQSLDLQANEDLGGYALVAKYLAEPATEEQS